MPEVQNHCCTAQCCTTNPVSPGIALRPGVQICSAQYEEKRDHEAHDQADAQCQRDVPQVPYARKYAGADYLALTDGEPFGLAVLEHPVSLAGLRNLLSGRLGAHRHVPDGFSVLADRSDIRQHPVVIAIFTAILHQTSPWDA